MPYDPSTDAGYLRLLISDVSDSSPVFDEAELAAFLTREGSIKRAAVRALLTIANNELLLAKVIRSQDVQTDGAKLSAELRALAAVYKAEADAEETAPTDGAQAWAVELVPYSEGFTTAELTERETPWWLTPGAIGTGPETF